MTCGRAEPVDVVVVGGGIVGLATARSLLESRPGARVVVAEKEAECGRHQTGHNSGVIHSGVYYAPGSLKARLCAAGNRSMVRFCAEQGLAYAVCGKLIVAADAGETARLDQLYQRGVANGLPVERLDGAAAREREPHVEVKAALWVPTTGLADYAMVARRLAELVVAAGGEVRTATEVHGLVRRGPRWIVTTSGGELDAAMIVNCGGLQSDRLARLAGTDPGAHIIPFRGEYFELVPNRRHLVKGLVYPVPDPSLPFLGVHLTRQLDGSVHAGPNAVLGLRREAYRRRDVDPREVLDLLAYRGMWRLARRHWRTGAAEVYRSLRKAAFVRSLQRLVPELEAADVVPAPAGVRAQAVLPDGGLVDDFLIVEQPGAVHVCNAPSPAATASLEIGRIVADRVMASAPG